MPDLLPQFSNHRPLDVLGSRQWYRVTSYLSVASSFQLFNSEHVHADFGTHQMALRRFALQTN